MKCIVAVALANGSDFGVPEIMVAAGICTGGVMLLLGVTGLMRLLYKLVPFSVVSGVQLAQGLSFAMTALNYVEKIQDFRKPESNNWEYSHWLGLDGLVLAITCACVIIIVDGVGQEVAEVHQKIIVKFSRQAWKEGFMKGTIPQLPLTILNSVISVCNLSSDLFPGKDFSAGLVSMTSSGVGSGLCHAAMGQGPHWFKILSQFPVGFLGVMLFAMASRKLGSVEDCFVSL
ncbi:hypothetical protein L484_014930 [Morus notabilis]|uniref:Uncharacterized protein n=1 Tax=Morus notabilis TaxID=981085 RepID=W9QZ48_9ROSA|nr:hypothetical protein L484_014930 [Morus notabilis]